MIGASRDWRAWLLVGLLAAAGTGQAADRQPEAPRVADLAWLAGHWQGDSGGVRMEEVWLAPAGGLMVGIHRDVAESGRTFFEYLRIEDSDAGPVLRAGPRGREPTAFALEELGSRRVVFANPQHDYPQRILYWLDADGRLHARIEGEEGGELKGSEWVWSRGG